MTYQPLLFEENIWVATGVYIDDQGRHHPVAGEAKITHAEGLWINETVISLRGDKKMANKTRYEIIPMERGQELTSWSSENEGLGTMTGNYIIVDDAVLSTYTSRDGNLRGTECLHLIDDDLYTSRGCLLRGDRKISSWALELRKK